MEGSSLLFRKDLLQQAQPLLGGHLGEAPHLLAELLLLFGGHLPPAVGVLAELLPALRGERLELAQAPPQPILLVVGQRAVAAEALSQLLAGQSGRLFLELRDRQGLAYSVTAVNVEGIAPGYLALYMGTAPEKLDRAREGMLAELRRLLDAPAPEAELDGVRRHLIGNFAIDQQRSAVRAGEWPRRRSRSSSGDVGFGR